MGRSRSPAVLGQRSAIPGIRLPGSGVRRRDDARYEDDGRRWPGILATVVIGLLLVVALLVGILPPPLGFIGVLLLARVLIGSFEER